MIAVSISGTAGVDPPIGARRSACAGSAAALLRRTFCLLAIGLAAASADATTICRWVDASGRTQLAEIVPEKYAQSAQCTDSKQFDVPPDRAQQARESARKLRDRADIGSQKSAEAAAPAAQRASAPAVAKRPAQGVDQSTDCATWRRLYEESAACFAPYRTVGGTKAEAFEKCREIPAPDLKCGPVVN